MAPSSSKRRATSVPPAKAPKTVEAEPKKAKVVDPATIALNKLLSAVEGELRYELSPNVADMVLKVAPEALTSMVEDRSAIETEFAKLVGAALQQAQASLATKLTEAQQAMEIRENEVKEQAAALEQVHTVKAECDVAVEAAAIAEQEAKDVKNTEIVALNAQKEEESKLDETKEQLQQERDDAQFALDTLKGEVPSTKDAKKLSQIMTKVGAPEAMVVGLPMAVGKDGDIEKMIVTEAIKVMEKNMAEVQGKQFDFQKTVDSMAVTTKTMEDEVTARTDAHTERSNELSECKAQQKTAAQGIKDAEATQKQGNKVLAKAQKEQEVAETDVANAAEVYLAYEFLLAQTNVPAEPETVAEEPTEEEVEEVVEEKVADVDVAEAKVADVQDAEEMTADVEMMEEKTADVEMAEAADIHAMPLDVKLAEAPVVDPFAATVFADVSVA